MILQNIPEISLYPVADRGKPNLERIQLRIQAPLNIGQYGVMIGYRSIPDQNTQPIPNLLYWFGDGLLNAGDWILLYTGSGKSTTNDWHDPPGSKYYSIHWGHGSTLFTNSSIVPILFRTDAVNIGDIPQDVPQLGVSGT